MKQTGHPLRNYEVNKTCPFSGHITTDKRLPTREI